MPTSHPAGHALRRPYAADAEAVLALLQARERADLGRVESRLEDVPPAWTVPGSALDADAWVAREQLALFESAGMAVVSHVERWEKTLGR